MKKGGTTFCPNCGKEVSFEIKTERISSTIRNVNFNYIEHAAYCNECGDEVYVAEINDLNVDSRENSFRKAANLISVEEIQNILNKYNIGAGPLARIMGFGEITINRYILGQLPSKKNSELLLEVHSSHKKMEEYLEQNKDKISHVAYEKCRNEINKFNDLFGSNKIEKVTRYLLFKINDVTPLSLQKLLYYSQSFFRSLYNEELFPDNCQAWAHGPVYPDVYYKFKDYGYDPIEKPTESFSSVVEELSTKEINFLDAIISAFGGYSGTILENITHNETPWLDARGNLQPNDRSVTVISKENINNYFKSIIEKYQIITPSDIVNYSKKMAQLV